MMRWKPAEYSATTRSRKPRYLSSGRRFLRSSWSFSAYARWPLRYFMTRPGGDGGRCGGGPRGAARREPRPGRTDGRGGAGPGQGKWRVAPSPVPAARRRLHGGVRRARIRSSGPVVPMNVPKHPSRRPLLLLTALAVSACAADETGGEAELRELARGIHERVITLDTHVDINPDNFTAERNYSMDLPTQVTLGKMEQG